jgi:hypothetical protein
VDSLRVVSTSFDSVTLAWHAQGDEQQWQVVYWAEDGYRDSVMVSGAPQTTITSLFGSQKYWFRESGSMATGWADVDDAYKRYFDGEGHMLTGWQQIGDRTFYFRPSGAMQTGKATIDGVEYEFTASGTLKS